MGLIILGSLFEELKEIGLPRQVAAFVKYYDYCYSNDRDVPDSYPRDVFKVCLLVSGAHRVMQSQGMPEPKKLDSLSQIFRRKGVIEEIVGFVELVETMESMAPSPSEYWRSKLDPICRWMMAVQPANLNGPSEMLKQRKAALQKVVGHLIKLPNLQQGPCAFNVPKAIGQFMLEYAEEVALPEPGSEQQKAFQGMIDHICSEVPDSLKGELPRIQESLQSYLGACVDPEADLFRLMWKLVTVSDEELAALIQSRTFEQFGMYC